MAKKWQKQNLPSVLAHSRIRALNLYTVGNNIHVISSYDKKLLYFHVSLYIATQGVSYIHCTDIIGAVAISVSFSPFCIVWWTPFQHLAYNSHQTQPTCAACAGCAWSAVNSCCHPRLLNSVPRYLHTPNTGNTPNQPFVVPVLLLRCWLWQFGLSDCLHSLPFFLLPYLHRRGTFFTGRVVASDGIRRRVQLGELSHWWLVSVFALTWLSLVRKRRLWRTRERVQAFIWPF